MKNKTQQGDIFDSTLQIIQEILIDLSNLFFKLIKISVSLIREYHSKELKKIERKQLNCKKSTSNMGMLGIDTSCKKEIDISRINFARHSFIIGASGFGKTNLINLLQENSLMSDKPIIFFDPKGDLEALKEFKVICISKNKPYKIFSEHFSESTKLNPLKRGSVNHICERIMNSLNWSEQYYENKARSELNTILKKIKNKEDTCTFSEILRHLKLSKDKDLIGLTTQIENIVASDFGKILDRQDALDLTDIWHKGYSLYIGLSTQGYGKTAVSLGKIFLNELLYLSYKSLITERKMTIDKNKISVYFDEFGSIVTEQFIELLNKCRGAGIELTMAVQSASDIDRINPDLTKQIIENSSNLFILKQRVESSVDILSGSIGTIGTIKQTYMTEEGEKQSRGSVREVEELLVHPNIIKNLKIGQCILLEQGRETKIRLVNLRKFEMDSLIKKTKKIKVDNPLGVEI